MRYVFDECIPPKIPKALAALGEDCVPFSEHWPRGAGDLQWIPSLCSQGHCIVTADELLRNQHQRMALREHRARVVIFPIASLGFWNQVLLVLNRWRDVEKATRDRTPPYVLRFTKRGREPQELRL